MKLALHKENLETYFVIEEVPNVTVNTNDPKFATMVLYADSKGRKKVRLKKEFEEKFLVFEKKDVDTAINAHIRHSDKHR